MMTVYRGYTIHIEANQKYGVWSVDVRIWPTIYTAHPRRDMEQLHGYTSRAEAEAAGERWAKERIDQFSK
jgi:hypothetical protein